MMVRCQMVGWSCSVVILLHLWQLLCFLLGTPLVSPELPSLVITSSVESSLALEPLLLLVPPVALAPLSVVVPVSFKVPVSPEIPVPSEVPIAAIPIATSSESLSSSVSAPKLLASLFLFLWLAVFHENGFVANSFPVACLDSGIGFFQRGHLHEAEAVSAFGLLQEEVTHSSDIFEEFADLWVLNLSREGSTMGEMPPTKRRLDGSMKSLWLPPSRVELCDEERLWLLCLYICNYRPFEALRLIGRIDFWTDYYWWKQSISRSKKSSLRWVLGLPLEAT